MGSPKGQRRLAREAVLQALYLKDVASLSEQEVLSYLRSHQKEIPLPVHAFAESLLAGTLRHWQNLTERIRALAANWSVERMTAVDRNILRMSAYEITGDLGTPPKVAIDEALEIAKKYSGESSAKFINGILDKLSHEDVKK